jgi:hypothetical protein
MGLGASPRIRPPPGFPLESREIAASAERSFPFWELHFPGEAACPGSEARIFREIKKLKE